MSQAADRYKVFRVEVTEHVAGSRPTVSDGWAVYDTHQSPALLKSDVFSDRENADQVCAALNSGQVTPAKPSAPGRASGKVLIEIVRVEDDGTPIDDELSQRFTADADGDTWQIDCDSALSEAAWADELAILSAPSKVPPTTSPSAPPPVAAAPPRVRRDKYGRIIP